MSHLNRYLVFDLDQDKKKVSKNVMIYRCMTTRDVKGKTAFLNLRVLLPKRSLSINITWCEFLAIAKVRR